MKRIAVLLFAFISALSAYCQTNLLDGDHCFDIGNYTCAETKYNEAFKLASGKDKQIAEIRLSRVKWCANHIKIANQAFSNKKFEVAKENYLSVLESNPKDLYAIEQLVKCNNIINPPATPISVSKENFSVSSSGESKHSYSAINPKEFADFEQANFDMMNRLIYKEGDQGNLNYSAKIKFDIQGANQSELIIKSISNKSLSQYLSAINLKKLPSSRISQINIPSQEILDFNLNWETKKISTRVKSRKITIDNYGYSNFKYSSQLETFIKGQIQCNGLYNFESKEKNLNGISFEDLKLVSYTNRGGPANVVYSMILPGWGTSKVTNGFKGKGRMRLFLISAALSIGSKIYSNSQYDKYKSEAYDRDQYYEKADIANKVFLISGGISATIYLNDILYVFGRGIKNNNKSRNLKNELRKGPILLIESPLKP